MGLTRVLGEPGPQDGNGESGERRGPLLAALAHATDVRPGVGNDVAVAQADQLGDPQPGLDGEHEHGVITPAGPGAPVGCGQQGAGLAR